MKEHTQEPGLTASGNNAHEHGNCNLCDDLERQLEEAQAEVVRLGEAHRRLAEAHLERFDKAANCILLGTKEVS